MPSPLLCMRCGAPLGPGGACGRCVAANADTSATVALEVYRYLALGIIGVIAAVWLTPGRGSTLAEIAVAGPWLTGSFTQIIALAPCFLGIALHLVAARAARASGAPFPYADREIILLSVLPLVSFYGSVVLLDHTAAWLGGTSGAALVRRVRVAARATIVLVVVAAAAQQAVIVSSSMGSSPLTRHHLGLAVVIAWVAVVVTRAWLLVMLSNAAAARLQELRRAPPVPALEMPPTAAPAAGKATETAPAAPPALAAPSSGPPAADVVSIEDLLLDGPPSPSCPDCEPTIALVPYAGGQGHSCPRCRGLFLDAAAARRAVEKAGVRTEVWRAVIEQAHAGPTRRCPGCGGEATPATLRGHAVAVCRACGGLWTHASRPERRTTAPVAMRPLPERQPRPGLRTGAWAALGVLSLAGVAALVLGERALQTQTMRSAFAASQVPPPAPVVPRSANTRDPAARVSGAPSQAAPTLAANAPNASAAAPGKPPPAMTTVLLGGRTPDQWRDRLETLRRGGPRDAELYRLTRRRAEANGLAVEEGADGLLVQAGPALMADIRDRRSR
jgi:Zn-finger nucleic acid-binding protein